MLAFEELPDPSSLFETLLEAAVKVSCCLIFVVFLIFISLFFSFPYPPSLPTRTQESATTSTGPSKSKEEGIISSQKMGMNPHTPGDTKL